VLTWSDGELISSAHISTYTWVLPIYVYTVDALVFDELCEILSECIAVIDDCPSNDAVGCRLRRISPAAEGDNSLQW
jgi:hypothetical protein